MPQCCVCAKSYTSHISLGIHRRESACGTRLTARAREIQKPRRKRRKESVAGHERGLKPYGELPPGAGGAGPRRRGDYFNPVLAPAHTADALGYWEQEERIMMDGQDVAQLVKETLQGEAETMDVCEQSVSLTPPLSGGFADSVEDDGSESEPDADRASSSVLFQAVLNLVVNIGMQTGAPLVDRLLRIITQDGFKQAVDLMQDHEIDSLSSAREYQDLETRDILAETGFKEVWVVNPENEDEGECLFARDAAYVVKRQMEHASVKDRNFCFTPWQGQDRAGVPLRSHPMSGDLATRILPQMKTIVMENGSWVHDESFMAMLQLYSDKSHMSLNTKAHSFYPLHVSVLNLKSDVKDSMVSRGETIVAYLSTSQKWLPIPDNAERVSVARPGWTKESGESCFLDTIHKGDGGQPAKILYRCMVAAALSSIRSLAVSGLDFNDVEGTRRRGHLVIAAFSADTPEAHVMTCTKQQRCARCHVPPEDLYKPGFIDKWRAAEKTKKGLLAIKKCKKRNDIAAKRNKMVHAGFSPTEPVFLDWPFTNIKGLDVYAIARFDIMHAGPLGIFKTLAETVHSRCRSDRHISSAVPNANGVSQVYSKITNQILNGCNKYIEDIDELAPAVGFSVKFNRGKKKDKVDGFFTETGVASMLQAKDYRMAQQIMPFVGALIDRYCGDGRGEDECAPVITTSFVLYNEMDNAIRRKDMEEVGFTEDSVQEMERAITNFQRYVLETLGGFNTSGFSIPKWHAYNHVAGDVRDLGICTGFDTSVYESGHPVYKAAHKVTARRHASATADTTRLLGRNEAARLHLEAGATATVEGKLLQELVTGKRATVRKVSSSRLEIVASDTPALARTGQRIFFRRLWRGVLHARAADSRTSSIDGHSEQEKNTCKNFLLQMGDTGIAYTVLKSIRSFAVAHEQGTDETADRLDDELILDSLRIFIVNSGNIPGWSVPCLENLVKVRVYNDKEHGYTEETEVHVVDSWYRISQRIISAHSFSHGKKTFKDSVMIEGSTSSGIVARDEGAPEIRGKTSGAVNMRFGKIRGFLRITAASGALSESENQEYAVVDYYEPVPRAKLDDIDVALGCIKLRWARKMGGNRPKPWIDIVPMASLRARIHVVPAPRLRTPKDPELEWTDETFYVNRFKISNYEATYNKIDTEGLIR